MGQEPPYTNFTAQARARARALVRATVSFLSSSSSLSLSLRARAVHGRAGLHVVQLTAPAAARRVTDPRAHGGVRGTSERPVRVRPPPPVRGHDAHQRVAGAAKARGLLVCTRAHGGAYNAIEGILFPHLPDHSYSSPARPPTAVPPSALSPNPNPLLVFACADLGRNTLSTRPPIEVIQKAARANFACATQNAMVRHHHPNFLSGDCAPTRRSQARLVLFGSRQRVWAPCAEELRPWEERGLVKGRGGRRNTHRSGQLSASGRARRSRVPLARARARALALSDGEALAAGRGAGRRGRAFNQPVRPVSVLSCLAPPPRRPRPRGARRPPARPRAPAQARVPARRPCSLRTTCYRRRPSSLRAQAECARRV